MLGQSQSKAPCIFVLEPDDNVRPALKRNLQHWGYQVIMAIDEEDAIQRIQGGQTSFDLILLNQSDRSIDEMMAIGRQLCQSIERDSQIPIIIMSERYGVDLEGQDIPVSDNEFVTYLEDGEQLKHLLHRVARVQESE